jgi:hypothetical protein
MTFRMSALLPGHRVVGWCSTVAVSLTAAGVLAAAEPTALPLLTHITSTDDLGDVRSVAPSWTAEQGGTLTLRATAPDLNAWVTIPAPPGGWDLSRRASIEATITNDGPQPTEVGLWVVADRGWESIADYLILEPVITRTFSCPLRRTFPDRTPKLDPQRVTGVRVMLRKPAGGATVTVRQLAATGAAEAWQRPTGRLELPPIETGHPAAGRRVRYQLNQDLGTGIHCLVYLPRDWKPGLTYPLIVEYPGNIFFTPGCYSTGLPDQCAIGYGMTRGEGAIWVSLPFIDRAAGSIAENGWGNPDDTADYAVRVVEHVCKSFGGDRSNVVLTGFSRGAIACGFIGLRNDRIAGLWKAFHLCQHFDGDGWGGATMEGAIERARRFRGVSVFHTDNAEARVRPITDVMSVPTTFLRSGLGAHATAMFLDQRESTHALRRWFSDLTQDPRGVPGARKDIR